VLAVLAVIAAALAGVAAERRRGLAAERLAKGLLTFLLYGPLPIVIFFNLVGQDVGGGLWRALLAGYGALALLSLAAYALARGPLGLSRPATGAFIIGVTQVNTSLFGLPLALSLFGSDGLGQAVAYDSLVTVPWLLLVIFGIGAAFGTRAGEGFRARTRSFVVRNPPLIAVVAALVAPDALAPDVLVDATRVLVSAQAPVGFFAVGILVAVEARAAGRPLLPPLTRPLAAATVLRLAVAPALLAALAAPFTSLPTPLLLLAAMPTGVNVLVVAHAYGLDLPLAAGIVAWTTAIALPAAAVLVVVA
jgi:predicted permease